MQKDESTYVEIRSDKESRSIVLMTGPRIELCPENASTVRHDIEGPVSKDLCKIAEYRLTADKCYVRARDTEISDNLGGFFMYPNVDDVLG